MYKTDDLQRFYHSKCKVQLISTRNFHLDDKKTLNDINVL